MNEKEKLLHNIAAKYISSESIDVELTGNAEEMSCLFELLNISKKLKTSLDNELTSLDEVYKILDEKKTITQKFISLSGINWSL
jgi:hypothetical protein